MQLHELRCSKKEINVIAKKERQQRTRKNQARFHPGIRCVGSIFPLWFFLHDRFIHGQDAITTFLDFITTWNCIHQSILWQIMLEDCVPTKLIDLFKAYSKDAKPRSERMVNWQNSLRIRVWCSPRLCWPRVDVADLEYADDVILPSDSALKAEKMKKSGSYCIYEKARNQHPEN